MNLVLSQDEPMRPTATRETDARTALTRALKEYVEHLSVVAYGGREIRFNHVEETWAQHEQEAQRPAAAIYTAADGAYDASRLTPGIFAKLSDGTQLMSSCEFVVDLLLEAWCTDPEQRSAFVQMLEDAFNPLDWMYGFRLTLPHYFNVRAEYELKSVAYPDSEEEALQRHQKAVFTLTGRVPVLQLVRYPANRTRARVTVVDSPFEDP